MENENAALGWMIGLNYLMCLRDSVAIEMIDTAMNKLLSEYKWIKLRIQIEEKADEKNISFGNVVGEVVQEVLQN